MEIDVKRDEIGMNCSSALEEDPLQGRPLCAVQFAHPSQGCEDRGGASTPGRRLARNDRWLKGKHAGGGRSALWVFSRETLP